MARPSVKNPYAKGPAPRVVDEKPQGIISQPADVRKCEKPGHPHYDTRWGCPSCPRGEEKLRLEIAALKADVLAWKDAWFVQRDATGRMAWEIPIVTYLETVDIDPRVFAYFREVETALAGLFKILGWASSESGADATSDP